jgi:LL-diaminopimelate aminotransferase
LFAQLDELKRQAEARGVDIIDLGVGDPDLPTPRPIIERLHRAARDAANHRYPSYQGMLLFREAVADWCRRRFGVSLDPETEVLSLIGSKEGLAHIPLAFVNPGDVVLVPNPAYPVYHAATILAGGEPYELPLLKENGYLPDLSINPRVLNRAKLIFLNYPNNPTAAVADEQFFRAVIDLAHKYGLIICHDAAYSEIAYDGFRPPSILQYEGAREVAVEFHSLSKTFNMTGWRIGFAVGNKELISGLGKVKTNIDSGIFQAVQYAGIEALESQLAEVNKAVGIYQQRRDTLVPGLQELGLKLENPRATFYLWVETPAGYDSTRFTAHLLERAGIVTTPGVGFGRYGEGYVRLALTVEASRLAEALQRLAAVLK